MYNKSNPISYEAWPSSKPFRDPFSISPDTLRQLCVDLFHNYRELALHSVDQFLATPVNTLPTGQETGQVLAIDVGGTNLRVGFLELVGDSTAERSFDRSWSVKDHLKMDKAEDFFAWIGDCIAEVVRARFVAQTMEGPGPHVKADVIPIGIAWSFPLIQTSISGATLIQMGKGFAINSKVDLGELLLGGYERHTHSNASGPSLPRIHIAAITNDTLATLASLSYTARSTPERKVVMGLVVGTGVNAAIPMPIRALHPSKLVSMTLSAGLTNDDPTTCVNTEWGIKGTFGPLKKHNLITRWDTELDEGCEAPGYMPFEYMTGGRYLGEIVRLVFCDYLVQEEDWAERDLPQSLVFRNGVNTALLSSTVAREILDEELAVELTQALPAPEQHSNWLWTRERALVLKIIARDVRVRAAKMIAAAVVGALACSEQLVIDRVDSGGKTTHTPDELPKELVVAYTGGVISQYPQFLDDCQQHINELVSSLSPPASKQSVILEEVLNGGVTGAGVLAGTVWQLLAEDHAAA